MDMQYYSKKELLLLIALFVAASKSEFISRPKCLTKCGNVTIPFPFGTTPNCSLDNSFRIICNRTFSPPIPFLSNYFHTRMPVRVLNISLHGELIISLQVATNCNNETVGIGWSFNLTHFHLSSTRNKLTVVGGNTIGIVGSTQDNFEHYRECMSLYHAGSLSNGSCSGIGCCQTTVSQNLSSFYYMSFSNVLSDNSDNPYLWRDNPYPCSYAFLVKDEEYQFSTTPTKLLNLNENTTFPVVLDWTVGNQTCQDARKNASSYACKSEHSECYNPTVGYGYLCRCSTGFNGNPYLSGGCEDINECEELSHDCFEQAKCINSLGTYHCSCPNGYKGNGKIHGTGCKFKTNRIIIIALSVSVSILTLLGGIVYAHWTLEKKKLIKLKEQFFQKNGGLLLQQQITKYKGSAEMIKIFTLEELKEATNNFDEGMVLGQGGQGVVYKGILPNDRVVAIKKSRISNPNQVEHFINEVIMLSRINHRNVVKLLGCCLEIEVPLLVYEFVPNGTLYEHLHDKGHSLKLTWKTRLQIATETVGVLAYLHSATSTPIIHRDVKTANILLDYNLIAKVSDFGASRIIPLDQTQLTTLVQGTLGYIDPEYFQTSQLTEKSDVFSFGVVLVELLTGKKALSLDRPEAHRNLVAHFHASINESGLLSIVDIHIIDEANVEQLLAVATIAEHCLRLKGEERPTMKEVAIELHGISTVEKHRWEKVNISSEKTQKILKATPSSFSIVYGADERNIHSNSDTSKQISWSLSGGR